MPNRLLLVLALFPLAGFGQRIEFVKDSLLARYEQAGSSLRKFHLKRLVPPDGNWSGYEVGTMTSFVSRGETGEEQGRWLLFSTGAQAGGKRKGLWRFYGVEHKTNRHVLLEEASYADGTKDGEALNYFPDGKLAARIHWQGGRRNGIATIFYPNGQVYATGNWRNDTLDGTVRAYLPGAYPLRTMNYRLGKLHGPFKTYHWNAQLKEEGSYSDDALNGDYRYYYPNGRLWVEREYRRDRLMSIVTLYDSTGRPLNKGSLKEGVGTVNIYNAEGALEAVRHYEDGLLVKEEKLR